jgi:tetratricopeptide (TPR) repeat protein
LDHARTLFGALPKDYAAYASRYGTLTETVRSPSRSSGTAAPRGRALLGLTRDADTDARHTARILRALYRLPEQWIPMGRNHKLQQQYTDALAYYQQALPLVRGTRTGYVEAIVEANLSQINARLGRYHDALHHAESELALRQGSGDPVGEGYAMHDLAVAWQGLGDHDKAIVFGECAIATYRSAAATERYLAHALETMAESFEHTGNRAKAVAYLAEAVSILTESGDPHVTVLRRRLHDLGVSPWNTRRGAGSGSDQLPVPQVGH